MSALATATQIASAARTKLDELKALREMSHIVAEATEVRDALDALARVSLRVRGVYKLQIHQRSWGMIPESAALGSAVSGPVRIFFDLHTTSMESPVRFARFVSEQVRNLGAIFELDRKQQTLREKIEALQRVIERRKIIWKARAILRRRENLDDQSALRRLIEYGRNQRKSLYQVALAFLVSEAAPKQVPIAIRRFVSTEVRHGR